MADLGVLDAAADFNVEGEVRAVIQVTGTFTATLTFSTSVDKVNFVTSQVLPVGAVGTPVTTATAPGIWGINLFGQKLLRVKATAYTDGTAVVTKDGSQR